MKIIEITKEQIDNILKGEQIRISLIETEVEPLDDIMFKNDSQVVGVRVIKAYKAHLQDMSLEDMWSEGIRVRVPPILEYGPAYPDDFDTWTKEHKDKYFRNAAISTYIAKWELSQDIENAYIRKWDSNVKPLNKKYKYENNPVVTVVEFDTSAA